MTTQEFITKTYNTKATKERRCSSVFTDYEGIVYSYGYHYPLAFHIKGLDFVNEIGYSNTTAKHINWARHAIGYGNYIGVKLNSSDALDMTYYTGKATEQMARLEIVKLALERELASIRDEMSKKTRKDTQVYKQLETDEVRTIQSLLKIEKAVA